ncbi:MAG: lipid-A-disaccharide synthase N-terminal domain-containing protein [Phycisphaerae bacterium]|nr:lipid-A-disaccharide synthase N-terminal domain-containing protein [Phycisphaerae bacterium]
MLAEITWQWIVKELQNPLVLFGFAGQFVFFLRFAVQWFASERRGRSHIPIAFWYLSLIGGGMTFVYAALKPDLVFMTAQALGLFIYVRNLMLIYRRKARAAGRRRGFPVIFDDAEAADATPVPRAEDPL